MGVAGFAAELRDDAAGLRRVHRRVGRSPLGSAAGYGSPGLPLDRAATARALGFADVQEPVTAVQLSRGKAEAELLFEITLLMQDLGRFAADVLLFYTQEFAFVELPDAFTTGSSIMPQKRNPDVFELVRGRSATAQACLVEALGIFAKLPSGYQRDLQLLKLPLFRGIDLALATTEILVPAIDAMQFRPENIALDPSIHAAEQANALVVKRRHSVPRSVPPGRRGAARSRARERHVSNGVPVERHAEVDLAGGRDAGTRARPSRGRWPSILGISFTEIGPDFLRATMPVDERTCQPMRLLHGGASVVLAETLGSTGANLLVDLTRCAMVGQEINANHLRAVPIGGIVTGTARPLHIGARSQVWGIEIVDERGRLVCVSRMTLALVDRPAGAPLAHDKHTP